MARQVHFDDEFRRGRVYELYPEGFGYIFDEEDPSCSFLFRLEHLEGHELSVDHTDPDGIPVMFRLGEDDLVDCVVPALRMELVVG